MDQQNSSKQLVIGIAGTLPPPIGGVTIHVKRLIEHLEQKGIPYLFFGKSIKDVLNLLFKKETPELVHIHHSNAFVKWIIVKVLNARRKNTIITIHRNLEREKGLKKYFTNSAIKSATIPIVLNQDSFQKAKQINNRTEKISPFIPPQQHSINSNIDIGSFIKNAKSVFCTNAYDLAFDYNKNEIYQISKLVDLFSQLENDMKLIISDPSGNNYSQIKEKTKIPENILIIPKPHNFIDIILQSDCLIRATTTDGDSISIKEALYFGKNVIASNCVDRPQSCTLYETYDTKDLKKKIIEYKKHPVEKPKNGFPEILGLYQAISQSLHHAAN